MEGITCSICGEKLPGEATYCSNCGSEQIARANGESEVILKPKKVPKPKAAKAAPVKAKPLIDTPNKGQPAYRPWVPPSTAPPPTLPYQQSYYAFPQPQELDYKSGNRLGYIGIILGLIGLYLPFIGIVAIILGFMAIFKRSKLLGSLSILLGSVGVVMDLYYMLGM
ncbi:MAG: zinc ribbon domain-containing protein [Thermoplasmata archaeon]|nr:MAG: zinc ribbon domain-containing protein [Thermoplasmata archaeon]